MTPDAIADAVATQCAWLARVARAEGVPVRFVKAHGALYHAADGDSAIADAVTVGSLRGLGGTPWSITLIGPPRGELAAAAARAGCEYAREAFADRGVGPDGTLLPRGQPGALITDAARVTERTRALCARGVVDTICVHGDTPGAVALARAARAVIDAVFAP
jgi:UPF0271 protein